MIRERRIATRADKATPRLKATRTRNVTSVLSDDTDDCYARINASSATGFGRGTSEACTSEDRVEPGPELVTTVPVGSIRLAAFRGLVKTA
jgi:hypothetical protein